MTTLIRNTCTSTALNSTRKTSLRAAIARALAVWRSRSALAQLTSAQLDDVGVTANQASTEVKRAVWDVPANWRD